MGLDQWAKARKGDPVVTTETHSYEDFDGNIHSEEFTSETWADEKRLCDWRKHPNLQGWMENLWHEKGNEGEFNCVEVELTLEDLDWLERDIKDVELPETGGFFFGQNSDEYYRDQDLQFIKDAREAINDGYTVVYSSWW